MSDPFLGEIQIFGFNFNPRGWAFCDGSLVSIQQNTALFALLGVTYGGNGQTVFGLPNLSARAACHRGSGPGLTPRFLGSSFGTGNVTLQTNQMPAHGHAVVAYSQPDAARRGHAPVAGGALSLLGTTTAARPFSNAAADTTLAPDMLGPAGGGMPHENRQPYLAMNFCIALQGIFPSRP
jgi:microcystin-dependent protein